MTARIGRPMRRAEEGERVMLGLRVSADLKNKLDEASRKSGRSQSQEAEMWLQQTFLMEEQAGALYQKESPLMRQINPNE
jgi:hypothetical protein